MTSVFMVVELSANCVIVLPVMVANTIAILVSGHMQHESVFVPATSQDGFDLPSAEERREHPVMHGEYAMRRDRERVVWKRTKVSQALERVEQDCAQALLVEVRHGRWAWVERRDLKRALDAGKGAEGIHAAVRTRPVLRIYPDLMIDQAFRNLAVYPLLPVASRMNPSCIVGTQTIEELHRAYANPRIETPAGVATPD